MSEWQLIDDDTPKDKPLLLYAPAENLSDHPDQKSEMRVALVWHWCWATHWMPLPEPPRIEP